MKEKKVLLVINPNLFRVVKCNQPKLPWRFDNPLFFSPTLPTSDTCLNDGDGIKSPFIKKVFKNDFN